jgi:hypothetical protein
MTSRDERMARNEAASREINEEIEEAYQGEPPANRLDIVCECALKMCDRSIDITMAEYRMVRSDLRQFAIVPEHLAIDIERIVYETDRFAVVAKREGTPADVARDENQQGEAIAPRRSRAVFPGTREAARVGIRRSAADADRGQPSSSSARAP